MSEIKSEIKMAELVSFVVRSNFIPAGMSPKPVRKEPVERVEGTVIAQSEKNDVSLMLALADLTGYGLVEAYYEARETDPGKKWSKAYFVLTYTFARGAEDKCLRGPCVAMLTESLWQVRVWDNRLFCDCQPKEGESALSVNCHKRQPLYNDDGSPVMQWVPLIVDGEQYTEMRVETVEADPIKQGDDRVALAVQYEDETLLSDSVDIERTYAYEVKRPLQPAYHLVIDGDTASFVPAK